MIRRNSFRVGSGSAQKITIRLLDDNEVIQVDFQPHHKGQFLMDYVCRQLNIAEKDYFGLRYVDATKQRHWMDLGKSITKQLKDMTPYIICLRFKFYPADPMLLKEEVSRYQLVLQLRRDLLHGRLNSTMSDIATLSSYIVQSELGDYDPEVHTGNYVAEYELVARQSAELEDRVKELHSKLKDVTASESDIFFLKKAATLDTYGVDPHPVKDQQGQGDQIFLGINHSGIATFHGAKKLSHYKWSQITKLNYESKMFIVHILVSEDSRNRKKETSGFKCQTSKACKYLWRCAVEQRLFFTCGSGTEVGSVRGGGLFGSRFRYSGKVQKEILEDPGPLRAIDGVIQRTPLYRSLQRNKTRSLSQSPMQLGYGSLPRSNHSAPSNGTRIEGGLSSLGSSGSLPLSTLSSPFGPEQTLPMLEILEEDSSPAEDKERKSDSNKDIVETKVDKQECTTGIRRKGEDDSRDNQSEYNSDSNVSGTGSLNLVLDTKEARKGGSKGYVEEASISESTSDGETTSDLSSSTLESDHTVHCLTLPGVQRSWDPSITSLSSLPTEQEEETATTVMSQKERSSTWSSTAFAVKRRKFGTRIPPRMDGIVNGGGAWAVARKHLWRFRSTNADIPYQNLSDSFNNNVESNLTGSSFDDAFVSISAPNLDQTTSFNSTKSKSVKDITNFASTDPPLEESSLLPREDTQGDFIPLYGSELLSVEIVDDDRVLRESKIDHVASSQDSLSLSQIPSSEASGKPETELEPNGNASNEGRIILSMWKIFIVCMICVLIALLFVAILAIEVDIDICQKMRRIPEVELFQTEVYEPVKYFIRDKIHNISDNISFTFQ